MGEGITTVVAYQVCYILMYYRIDFITITLLNCHDGNCPYLVLNAIHTLTFSFDTTIRSVRIYCSERTINITQQRMKRRSANPDYGDCSNNYLGNKYWIGLCSV